MKILFAVHQFYPESSGGTEHFLLNLAHAVQRRGHRAQVATYSMADGLAFQKAGALWTQRYIYERLPVVAFRHPRLSIDINSEPSDAAIFSFARDYLTAGKYDVVHMAHPMRVSSFATAAAELGIPYLVTLTDFWSICPKITLQTSYRNLCCGPEDGRACAELCPELPRAGVKTRLAETGTMLRKARAVVAPTAFVASLIQKQFADIPITVVPHGMTLRSMQTRNMTYTRDSHIVFAYCGGLSPHKGVHILVQAFRSLTRDNVSLQIFGEAGPNDHSYARELRRSAGGDNRIQFRGSYRAEEVGRVLQSIDVLVVPSLWYETYSFSLHEAFAAGIPVIASKVGVLSEKVREEETGLTFPLGDQAALAEQLRRLAENPTLLNQMKANLKSFDPPLAEEEAYCYERLYSAI